ncbi:MAG: hypothetical protein AB8B92_08640 [Gammaproteobacteria bacterium]
MKFKIKIFLLLIVSSVSLVNASGLEDQTITLKSNERFDLVQANTVTFKFQPLSVDARKLEITNDAAALGVAYLGQVKLRENNTALSALRSIADQIGESLDISFGVIADSNTSEALKANELLLLYHPNVTITLALARASEANDYEIICTYALKDLSTTSTEQLPTTPVETKQPSEPISEITPVEDVPEILNN